jgi:NAD(P)-dependent dehydrogenase (short-subunit alcohol dehydrogenase family)
MLRAATAKALAAAGAAVVVNYASDQKGADSVAAAITARGGKAVAVKADVAKPVDVRRLFEEAKKAFGRIDILVNNAGIYQFKPLEESPRTTSIVTLTSTCSARCSRRRKRRSISVQVAAA